MPGRDFGRKIYGSPRNQQFLAMDFGDHGVGIEMQSVVYLAFTGNHASVPAAQLFKDGKPERRPEQIALV